MAAPGHRGIDSAWRETTRAGGSRRAERGHPTAGPKRAKGSVSPAKNACKPERSRNSGAGDLVGGYPRQRVKPAYRGELPGRIIVTVGLFVSGACIAMIIQIWMA